MSDTTSTSTLLVLDGALNIRTIDGIHRDLRTALTEHDSVRIDCAAAETVDLSVIQLLLAARHSAGRAGKRLTLASPADGALRLALEQGGFLTADADPFWSDAA